MNKQVVTYLEAATLFKEHCEVVLRDKHLQIFGYNFPIMEVLRLIKESNRVVYNDIMFKWCADVGLHIK